MFEKATKLIPLALCLCLLAIATPRPLQAGLSVTNDGVVTLRSAYSMGETIDRIKHEIASKGLKLFAEIDQAKLADDAGVKLHPSTLLIFGNAPLGVQFIMVNPTAGLEWPVRLLVYQDEHGDVWTAYNDFAWVAKRHQIGSREATFSLATQVLGSITSSVNVRPK